MVKIKISIIVGLYNVEHYLRSKQLSSIFSQTYSDWELILVDDGSTDQSGKLCDDLASKDKRIRVIHKKNGGLGSARNAGLDVAKGKYVWFYDVDDEAHTNLLEYCVQEMESKQLQMLQFGFNAITPQMNFREAVHLNECLIEDNEQLRKHYLDDILFVRNGNGFAWNKMYLRSFLEEHKLRFENQKIQQDEVFNLKVYQKIARVYISSMVLYDYYIYEQGNNRSRFISNRFDIYKSVRQHFEELKSFWSLNDKRLDDYLEKRFYDSVIQCFMFNLTHPDCKWTKAQKKAEMKRINSDSLTQQAYSWASIHNNGFEQRLLRSICQHEDLLKLQLYTKVFGILASIRRKLR